jgi:transposase-like protein
MIKMTEKESDRTQRADPEVKPATPRRRFSAKEKLRILEEADACTEPGEIGALVRREGIYASYLSRWRKAREQGQLDGLSAKKRGPKRTADRELTEENAALRREIERLQTRLEQAETIIEVQKKLSQLLGLETPGQGNSDDG